ncbi:MAG: PLP-dependent aminotransferase family protein [Leptospiraceae bacterium]|nr:PLP-dependent aminotransferase family protein [Leptospiraceae bacterium]
MELKTLTPRTRIRRSAVRDILAFHNRPDMISLAGGLPDPDSLPVAGIARSAQYVLSRYGGIALQYGTTEGFHPLREYIASMISRNGLKTAPEQILITSGSQQAMDLVGRYLLTSGQVFTTEPMYNGAVQSFELQGATIHSLACDEMGPTVEALRKIPKYSKGIPEESDAGPAFRGGFRSLSVPSGSRASAEKEGQTRILYLLPTLGNPTGAIIPEGRRQEIRKILQDSDQWLLEEDPYGDLIFDGSRLPYLSQGSETRSLLLGSFSKTVSPSLRIGWLRASEEEIQEIVPLKQAMDLHTNLLSQMILHRFLEDVDLDLHLSRLRQIYRQRMEAALGYLWDANLPLQPETVPVGGMFLWIKTDVDTDALGRAGLEEGVAIVPGSAFFSRAEEGKRHFRINFSAVSVEEIRQGMERLVRAYHRIRGS